MSTSPLVPATDRWGDRLPRRLGFWSAVAVLVGSTIGGGIFRTPAVIAERVPAPLPMFGVWVLGGLLALCGALTYAELAALFPRSGGVYVYIREGFGRLPAALARPGPGAAGEREAGALRRRGGHHGHRGAELLRRPLERAGLEPHHRRQIRRVAAARAAGVSRGARRLEPFHHGGGSAHTRPVRPGVGLGAVGVRRLGRPFVRGRRGA